MSITLLETIQQNLGYPALQKIDPNTQQVVLDEKTPEEHKFSQAAIPAVLTGLYKYVQSDEGAADYLRYEISPNWVKKIFGRTRKKVVQIISAYAKQSTHETVAKMNAIATEAVKVANEALPVDASIKDVKFFFSNQINHFLLFLPAALNMGELLNDSTLDDKTNKMEGPMSSLMQTVGAAFSSPVIDEEIKNL